MVLVAISVSFIGYFLDMLQPFTFMFVESDDSKHNCGFRGKHKFLEIYWTLKVICPIFVVVRRKMSEYERNRLIRFCAF